MAGIREVKKLDSERKRRKLIKKKDTHGSENWKLKTALISILLLIPKPNTIISINVYPN